MVVPISSTNRTNHGHNVMHHFVCSNGLNYVTKVHFYPRVLALDSELSLKVNRNDCNNTNSWNFIQKMIKSSFPVIHAATDRDRYDIYMEEQKEKLRERLRSGTGYDRLKRMYSFDELAQPSPELRYIMKGGYASLAFGVIMGALSSFKNAKEKFMRQNTATAFESEYLARRQLADKMSLAAVKGGIGYGLKFGAFTTVYLAITMTAANFNNRTTIFEHTAAGAIFGAAARINYGLKGAAVAGCLGGFLGTLAGGLIITLMKISGISFEEFRVWQHEYYGIKLKPPGERK